MPKANNPPIRITLPVNSDATDAEASANKKSKRARPILSSEEFIKQHRAKAERLDAYVYRNYYNKVVLPREVMDEQAPEIRMALYANNMESRIDYVQLMHDELAPFLLGESRPLYWITLTPSQYAFDFAEACAFDVRKLQAWTRQLLTGLSFMGFVDVGCYPLPGSQSPIKASFHVHLIGWGVSIRTMHALELAVNARWRAFVPERPVFHWRQKSPAQAIQRIFYMSKAPLKAARWVPRSFERIDQETGEVTTLGEDRHYEQSNKTGQFARMAMIMQGRTLDTLAFAAGEGRPLLQKVNKKALSAFRRYEDRLDHPSLPVVHLSKRQSPKRASPKR